MSAQVQVKDLQGLQKQRLGKQYKSARERKKGKEEEKSKLGFLTIM